MSTQLASGAHPPPLTLPDVEVVVQPTIWRYLPDEPEVILQIILYCGDEIARIRGIRLDRVVVRLDLSDSDADRQVVVSFWVHESVGQAFEYLDTVDSHIQKRLALLGQAALDLYLDRITLQAQWL